MRFWLRLLLSLVLVAALGIALPVLAILGPWWFSRWGPDFTHQPSPNGDYVVVSERWGNALDGYMRVWIAARGDEQDQDRWTRIAPTVDGGWSVRWAAANHVVLVDHGSGYSRRQPYAEQRFGDVRIETRGPGYEDVPVAREMPQRVHVRLESAALPNWGVGRGSEWRLTRKIRVRRGSPVELLLSSDRDCSFTIEALRVSEVLPAEWPQIAWFMPTTVGEWNVEARVGGIRCDGVLIVEAQ